VAREPPLLWFRVTFLRRQPASEAQPSLAPAAHRVQPGGECEPKSASTSRWGAGAADAAGMDAGSIRWGGKTLPRAYSPVSASAGVEARFGNGRRAVAGGNGNGAQVPGAL